MKTLLDIYKAHEGKVSDKWSLYLNEYDRLFQSYRNEPISLLEIGIQNGGSLEIWSQYFPYAEHLVGCDINQKCTNLIYDDPRISVIVGDANSEDTFQRVGKITSKFDLIIDDGSHTSSDIVKSFSHYFPMLAEGGLFVAEDLHCSYWQEFEGGLFLPQSSITFFKRLADIVNFEHWGHPRSRKDLLKEFSECYKVDFDEDKLSQIHSVKFINSICVVEKKHSEANCLGTRFITGETEVVVPGHIDLIGTTNVSPSQSNNFWSQLERAPDEMWKETSDMLNVSKKELHSSKDNISRLESYVSSLEKDINEIVSSTSWKATVPIRLFGRTIKRLKKALNLFGSSLSQNKGLSKTLFKILKIYRNEGFKGFLLRIDNFQLNNADSIISIKGGIKVNRNDYLQWIRRYDWITDNKRKSIIECINKFSYSPLISIVMPVFNPNPKWLEEAINSVQKQLYSNWELCIADDASTNPEIRLLLEKYIAEDKRIKVLFRKENGHISAASNSALELVTGNWTALLDHDDILSEDALYWVVVKILSNPNVQMIYSDEDKIDENGVRYSPYFKTDWNLDLFYSHNMFCHFGVYKTDLINKIGGFSLGMEGAQDYDLALRCIELIKYDQIEHIPRILYHWRVHNESTAKSSEAKPYAMKAGERALNEHFDRMNYNGKVLLTGFGYRAKYEVTDPQPLVSIIIPTRDRKEITEIAVTSILNKTTYSNFEIIIIDNGSVEPETLYWFKLIQQKYSQIRVIRYDFPFNYSEINNFGVKNAKGKLIGLVNNDVEVISSEWLTEMVSHALRPDIGCVGAKLYYTNNTIQHGGVVLGIGGVAGHSHKCFSNESAGSIGRLALISNFSAVTGACLIVEKYIFELVGGLDQENLAIAFNDVDFCLKVREAGFRNIWTPYAELYHHESISRGHEDTYEKIERFEKESKFMKSKWGECLYTDPYYSPNLTLNFEDFSLAWPPRVNPIEPSL